MSLELKFANKFRIKAEFGEICLISRQKARYNWGAFDFFSLSGAVLKRRSTKWLLLNLNLFFSLIKYVWHFVSGNNQNLSVSFPGKLWDMSCLITEFSRHQLQSGNVTEVGAVVEGLGLSWQLLIFIYHNTVWRK